MSLVLIPCADCMAQNKPRARNTFPTYHTVSCATNAACSFVSVDAGSLGITQSSGVQTYHCRGKRRPSLLRPGSYKKSRFAATISHLSLTFVAIRVVSVMQRSVVIGTADGVE